MDGSLRRSFWRSIKSKMILLILLMVILIVVMGVVGTLYYQNVIKQKIDDDTRSSADDHRGIYTLVHEFHSGLPAKHCRQAPCDKGYTGQQ